MGGLKSGARRACSVDEEAPTSNIRRRVGAAGKSKPHAAGGCVITRFDHDCSAANPRMNAAPKKADAMEAGKGQRGLLC
jgi:hypothetical protein